jgi:2-alkenal reductase
MPRSFASFMGVLALIMLAAAMVFASRFGSTPGAARMLQEPSAAAGPTMDAVAIVERVAPAVVTVINLQQTTGPVGATGQEQPAGAGTGFIIDEQGHIVTNEHVVSGGTAFDVIFVNGETRPATLVGADPTSDLAVVKVDGSVPATVQLGDADALRVGEPVLAIGSPLGAFTNTVTEGIVSALDRTYPELGTYTDLIQHDAAINPGNSGGPLFNAAGEVVGVNTLGIPEAQGLFFAIPSTTVRHIEATLIENGRVVYPYFGVVTVPVTGSLAGQLELPVENGALVTVPVPTDSPAGKAGIQEGDVILALDGQTIDRDTPFVEALFQLQPGDTIPVTVQRGDEQLEVSVTLAERPPQ